MTVDFTQQAIDKESAHCYKIGLMSSLRRTSTGLLYCGLVMTFALAVQAQTIAPQGSEFPVLESNALRGDQVYYVIYNDCGVWRIPKAVGTGQLLGGTGGACLTIAVDDFFASLISSSYGSTLRRFAACTSSWPS